MGVSHLSGSGYSHPTLISAIWKWFNELLLAMEQTMQVIGQPFPSLGYKMNVAQSTRESQL